MGGLPEGVKTAFFGVGLAMIFFTAMVGQLQSQVNASVYMLDYCDNYFSGFTMWVAMALEFTGLLHASYLIAMAVNMCVGAESNSKEGPRSPGANAFYWARCLMSLAIVVFCGIVTVYALFTGQTTVWEGIPPIVSFIIFLISISFVGMLEGMQIAFFACAKLRAEERGTSKIAKMTAKLLFKGDGNNLPGFMIGRQLVAAAFPIAFMGNPITYILLSIALAIEFTGVCNGVWVLAAIDAKVRGFQRDEAYIGTAEE